MIEPSQSDKKIEIGVSKELLASTQKAKRAIINNPQERPSRPSVILKKLAKPTIKPIDIGIKKIPNSRAPKNGR